MGEGKSSVIAPLAVATLADQKTLLRLVILKPLSQQMFHLLAARLTGLCGRRVFFFPFSRAVTMGLPKSGNSVSLRGCHPTGSSLLELQKWLSSCSRDIFDESDEILHSKYQLIYTMGHQQPLEDYPDQWTTVQQFSLLYVDMENNEPGLFCFLHLLKPTPGTALVEWIVDDIMVGKLENVNFRFLNRDKDRQVVQRFITRLDVNAEDIVAAKHYFESSGKWKSVLLLLLCYVFLKCHWRVDYGLDLTRSMLAVPFRAKDVPSTNAEFGHSDIALLLTCLSYYYRGLDKDQLFTAIQLLLNSDNAAAEYETWTTGLDLPAELRQETGINLEDPAQFADILVPRFRRTKNVIDFYLSTNSEKVKTGFQWHKRQLTSSPTSIHQEDLLQSTSAEVLLYLQQPENGLCITPDNLQLKHVSLERLLLQMASQTLPVRILFDVGAQVLQVNQDAVVYFDNKDKITVMMRDGAIKPFIFSSFRDRLNDCIIYLDDAHTRGTDLKFPRGARALVTLGDKVTKDRLVQGK
ncbi:hypothetical protein BDP27DRAFT_1534679 [Rhodocollybia butyracea]|uniref:ubiquitinyl hydrolase 1 n=1 Tax=Rhodocollybia butyracea TaxID=206335 RepID=A0A9P5P584_9AGAR|nr:hypothetical protein BDP27DRAFT_1534679 [Rhodocollybia butyracea]